MCSLALLWSRSVGRGSTSVLVLHRALHLVVIGVTTYMTQATQKRTKLIEMCFGGRGVDIRKSVMVGVNVTQTEITKRLHSLAVA